MDNFNVSSTVQELATGHISGLTTPQIAGLIAVGIFSVQLLFSLTWPFVVLGLVSAKESAVTWSVVSRIIHNSYWPTILRSDSTASSGVRVNVVMLSYLMLLTSILVTIASIVTPLGLYETVLASKNPVSVRFEYAPDSSSAFGLGTPPRASTGSNRRCGNLYPIKCPNDLNTLNITSTGNFSTGQTTVTSSSGYLDISIPQDYMKFWESGITKLNQTVSSIFDISWRTYTTRQDTFNNFTNNGSLYIIGSYRNFQNVILNDAWEAIEGLIVDTKSGGVGFRNHTLPADGLQYGAQWAEDILFIEPVTECANTNLTLEYTIGSSRAAADPVLVDQGGFANINHTYPLSNLDNEQDDPDLAFRAYKGAWLNNAWLMLLFNITNQKDPVTGRSSFSYLNSHVGNEILLPKKNYSDEAGGSINPNAISIGAFASFMDIPSGNFSTNEPDNFTYSYMVNAPPNPWKLTRTNFTDIRQLCMGALRGDFANITNVAGNCGLVLSVGQRKDNSSSLLTDPGTKYSTSIYNCASASRAIIKTVRFSYNSSTGLKGLNILDIQNKKYASPSEQPLWAVENTKYRLGDLAPLWGIVEKEDQTWQNISYRRAPHLWLTGDISEEISSAASQNLAGAEFATQALASSYDISSTTSSLTVADYSGKTSLPLYMRWRSLTQQPGSTAKIINLVWTDIAANAVVGSRGWMPTNLVSKGLAKRAASSDADNQVPVTVFHRAIKYKIVYAIPAFLVLAIVVLALASTCLLFCFRRVSPSSMKGYLARLSAGRVMTSLLEKDAYMNGGGDAGRPPSKSTSKWVKRQGRTQIDVTGKAPRIAGYPDMELSDATVMLNKRTGSPVVVEKHE